MRTFFNWVHSLGYVVRGAAAIRRGDDDGVIANYSRAIEISPDDLEYYFARAQAYWHKQELGLAIADYTAVIGLDPANIRARLNRGAAYVNKGYIQQAMRDLNIVIEATDGLAFPYYLRALCEVESKDYDLALADVEKVLEADPADDKARKLADHVRGQIHLAEHRKKAEQKDITKFPNLPN